MSARQGCPPGDATSPASRSGHRVSIVSAKTSAVRGKCVGRVHFCATSNRHGASGCCRPSSVKHWQRRRSCREDSGLQAWVVVSGSRLSNSVGRLQAETCWLVVRLAVERQVSVPWLAKSSTDSVNPVVILERGDTQARRVFTYLDSSSRIPAKWNLESLEANARASRETFSPKDTRVRSSLFVNPPLDLTLDIVAC